MTHTVTDTAAKFYSSEVFGAGDHDEAPDIAELTINEEAVGEIIRLAQVVASNKLHLIERFDFTPKWFQKECIDDEKIGKEGKRDAITEGSALTAFSGPFLPLNPIDSCRLFRFIPATPGRGETDFVPKHGRRYPS